MRQKNIGKVVETQKVYLSKPELAAYLGTTVRYIDRNIILNPDIEVYRLSTKLTLFRKDNIDAVIRKCRV